MGWRHGEADGVRTAGELKAGVNGTGCRPSVEPMAERFATADYNALHM